MAQPSEDDILARAAAIMRERASQAQAQQDTATAAARELTNSDTFTAMVRQFQDTAAKVGPVARKFTELNYALEMMERMQVLYPPA